MFKLTSNLTLTNSFIRGLACAAINSRMHSILIFDAPFVGLKTTSAIFAKLLECATGQQVEQVSLGVSELDDDLWGALALSSDDSDTAVLRHPGLFTGNITASAMLLVLIPDLSMLNLSSVRTCVMLIDADVAHLERHGHHERWQPNICWLAGCARSEVGSISPHLLDRFALRLSWRISDSPDKSYDLLPLIIKGNHIDEPGNLSIPLDMRAQIQKAEKCWARLSDAAIPRVLDYSLSPGVHSPRRDLALARLALSMAKLDGEKQASASHVDSAANLIGLSLATQKTKGPSEDSTDSSSVSPASQIDFQSKGSSERNAKSLAENDITISQQGTAHFTETIYGPDQPETIEIQSLPLDPYPEDSAPSKREVDSLRLPSFRHTVTSSGQGPIIGVEQASSLRDLSIVSTLFAAAPFQTIRRKYRQAENRHFWLSAADLRSYRREPVAEKLLLLLLDYTSLRGCDWQQALIIPYLRKAYVERNSICIVQVGAAKAVDELKAELVSARSILVPSIGTALETKMGKATPLAHGFELALQTLRHALQHGRGTVRQALLIIISDGRGNVPLQASLTGWLTSPVNRTGIEDALQVAQQICNLQGVKIVLLNPQPKQYPELPYILAETLGAEVINIEPLKEVEA